MTNKRYSNVWIILLALGVSSLSFYSVLTSTGLETTQKPRSVLFQEKFGDINPSQLSEVTRTEGITNVRVNAIDGVSEPSIAVNPVDANNFVVATNDFRLSGNSARIFYSLDKGNYWGFATVPVSGLSGYTEATDPAIAFDNDGVVYYAIVHYQSFGNGDGIFVNRSLDKGKTWMAKATEVKKNNDALVFEDRPAIAVDLSQSANRNAVYVAWVSAESGSSKIFVSKSNDKGVSFSAPVLVAEGKVNTPDVKVDKSGKVVVTWLANDNAIYTSVSVNAETFSQAVKVTDLVHAGEKVNNIYLLKKNNITGIKVKSYPRIATDMSDGTLYISYAARNGNDLSDVFVCSSVDAVNWTAPVRVNNDNTVSDQFAPEITALNGKAFVSWQDSRDDASNLSVASYMATVNGSTVLSNSRISSASFEPSGILLNNYMGDYNGIAASASEVVAVWTDGRNGLFDVYASITPANPNGVSNGLIATDFKVMQNYPNPFNPSTLINYSLPKDGNVNITLFDVSGRAVTEIYNGFKTAGNHSVEFNALRSGLKLASGTYIYKVSFGGQMIARKMTLLK